MTSRTTKRFRQCFAELPTDVRKSAAEAYALWRRNPWHPSLRFKQIHPTKPIFSVRIGIHWRAVCVRNGDVAVWYFIGSHAQYDRLIKGL